MTIEALKEALKSARARSLEPKALREFSNLNAEQARRAVYFCELSQLLNDMGLSNAFEETALSVEPTHPVPPSRMQRQMFAAPGGSVIRASRGKLGLSLLSLPMLQKCYPASDASKLIRMFPNSRLNLLDPLYGFVFMMGRDEQIHNHCFAIDFWQSRLRRMPAALSAKLWETRADNMLSGGAFAGRLIFQELVGDARGSFERSQPAEIEVRSESHYEEIVAALQSAAERVPQAKLWFRGQRLDHQVPDRSSVVRFGIAPYSNIPESDLTPSIYRKYDGFLETLELYEQLLTELAEWLDVARRVIPDDQILSAMFARRNPLARSAVALTAFQLGLVLQQYGAPSSYLDITSDPAVAAWFATHVCTQDAGGRMQFRQYSSTGASSKVWPTVFVFPLVEGAHTFLDLAAILPGDLALRPSRQSCGLLGGAGNLARNYCARYVGLKLRLGPQFSISRPAPASYYFPSDSEDVMLGKLIEGGLGSPSRRYPVTTVFDALAG